MRWMTLLLPAAAGAFLLSSLRPAPGDVGAEGQGHSLLFGQQVLGGES